MIDPLFPDHLLRLTGTWEGTAMWELDCTHGDDPQFYVDEEGIEFDECLIQGWWEAVGFDIIGNSNNATPNGILLFTTYHFGGEPLLVGAAQYAEWRENHADD